MKSEMEFLQGVYRKAKALQEEEAGRAPAPRRARRFASPAVAAALLVVAVGGLVFFGNAGSSTPEPPPTPDGPAARGAIPAAFGLEPGGLPAESSLAGLAREADAVLLVRLEGGAPVVAHRFLAGPDTPGEEESLPVSGLAEAAGPEESEAVCFLREEENGSLSLLPGGDGVCLKQEDASFQGATLRFTREELESVIGFIRSEK